MPKSETRDKVNTALSTVGLAGLGARLPSELSGGQQQRVAVARALVLEPSVLLFDEPLSNLDARLRRQMREEIRDLQQRLGLTVVYVTHDQSEALAVSDRIIVMDKAVIAQEGAPRELYAEPRDAFVAGFMGEANRVRGTLTRREGGEGEVALGPIKVSVPHRGLPDGAIDVAIRPESIRLEAAGTSPLDGDGTQGGLSRAHDGVHRGDRDRTAVHDRQPCGSTTRRRRPRGGRVRAARGDRHSRLARVDRRPSISGERQTQRSRPGPGRVARGRRSDRTREALPGAILRSLLRCVSRIPAGLNRSRHG